MYKYIMSTNAVDRYKKRGKMNELIYLLIAYLVGSISPSYFFGKLKGKDLRKIGRRNTGATNTYKNVGPVYGVITALFDIFKGVIIVILALYFGFNVYVVYLSALLVTIGHNYPFYLKFRGGRGIATSIGAFFVILVYYNDIYALIAAVIVAIRSIAISPNFRKWIIKKMK